MRTRGRAIREDGKTTKLCGAIEDVTVRHDLARHEARLAMVAQQMASGVIMLDRQGRTEWINEAYTRVTGYTIEDLRGRFPGEILNGRGTDPAMIRHITDRMRDGLGFEAEILDYAKDSRPVLISVICSPVRDTAGMLTGFVSVVTDVTARRDAELLARHEAAERERAEGLLRDVLDTLPTGITAYDADERFILANRAYAELFPVAAAATVPGRTLEEVLRQAADQGQYADFPTDPAERETWFATHMNYFRTNSPRTIWLADGRVMQVCERRSESGTVVTVRTDVTALHAAEAAARREAAERERAEALLRDVLDTLPSGVVAYDRDERFVLSNRAHAEMLPVVARFLAPGRRLEEIVRLSVENGQVVDAPSTPAERDAWIVRQLAALRDPDAAAHTLRTAKGAWIQVRTRQSQTGNRVIVLTDTTDLKRAEHDLRMQAERDSLTLLANRASFLAALDRVLADVARDPDPGGALLLLDIDYFKQINDTLGHDAGDALLVEIAARLRAVLRGSDVPARLGGDEFGVVMPGLTDAASLAARMDAIHAALSAPAELAGRRLPIGVSVGVTMFPSDGMDGAKLLKNADLALYEAKRQGRGRWSAFRPEQSAAMAHNMRLADALRGALARNRISVALQPKRWLRADRHAGFEALARWHDGTCWVPPAEFIPVAEDIGLIGALGRAVMEETLARVRDLRARGLDTGPVAVNATGPQLLDSQFLDETMEALLRHGLRPADLELELTETMLFGRAAGRIDAVLRQFSQAGVALALDDFGTGYASLSHLSRLPINRLKIDASFVAGIGGGEPGGVIARTVVSLAHGLEMEVIAEGVETTEQMAFLEAAGCDIGQGHLFSKPLLTTDEAADYLSGQAMRGVGAKHKVAEMAWH